MTTLTTSSIMDCVLSPKKEDRDLYERLKLLVKRFEAAVWFQGLQEQNNATRERGVSQEDPSRFDREDPLEKKTKKTVELLAYTIAGRTMITLQRGETMLSMVADESSKESRTGLQGIYGTEAQVTQLVDDAIAQWEARPRITNAPGVHIAGFPV